SHEIRVERIADLGELHHGRKRIQPSGKDIREFYEEARHVLKHPLLEFDDADVAVIAESFAQLITERRYTCYACVIMPDHVHVLIRKHRDRGEMMIEELQNASRANLIEAGRRNATHPVWGGPGWKVFQYTADDFVRTIKYIQDNPVKISRPVQHWDF